jgi:predicted transposase YbfD/YdcC
MPAAMTLLECLSDLPDPRIQRTRRHRLLDILVITICAFLCGAQGWDDIVEFAHAKHDWLQERLPLPNGIPCADTLRRVLARLDPDAFAEAFVAWIQAVQQTVQKKRGPNTIAVDGKTLRHSFDTAAAQSPIHMVSAWASGLRLVLGQVKVDDKSNEITAVPALLGLLDSKGCIVTTDAMSCQKAIAAQIIRQEGDYILAVKDNQPHLLEDTKLLLAHALQARCLDLTYSYAECVQKGHGRPEGTWTSRRDMDVQKGHGRIETRRYGHIDLQHLDAAWEDVQEQWAGLRSVLRVERVRQMAKKTTQEVHFYISSLPGDVKKAARALRQHWGIQNRVHWVLDVVFDEDACRIRKDNGPQNLAVIGHIALNLLRQESSHKRGIKARQKRAGWDNEYLTQLLTN